jgi:hypothetical protein
MRIVANLVDNSNDGIPSICAALLFMAFNGNFALSFSRSSTIDERTCAMVRHQDVVDDIGQALEVAQHV